MATSTFNANFGGTDMIESSSATWATVRGAATGSVETHPTFTRVKSFSIGGVYYIGRTFTAFQTSAIADTDTIESATLKFYVYNLGGSASPLQNLGAREVCLVAGSQASGTVLVSADYNNLGSTEQATRLAITSTGYKTFTLNSTGLGNINKTGYSKFALRAGQDNDNVAPVNNVSGVDFLPYRASVYYTLTVTHWGVDRYWVGGTGNWSDRANWADSSGGAGGAPVPTYSNNIYFDANSFSGAGQIVTVNQYAYGLDMNWTGATNSPTITGHNNINLNGDITLIAAMTWNHTRFLYLHSTRGSTFTSEGLSFPCNIVFSANGSSWTLGDNLTTTETIYLTDGELDTNGKTVTIPGFYSNYTNTRELTLGASTINVSGGLGYGWYVRDGTGLTLNAGTSTINCTFTSDNFRGGGKTYNDVNLNADNIGITESNTFADLKLNAGFGYRFFNGYTQTVTTLTAVGTAGNLITLRSDTPGSTYTISDAAGTNTCDYLDIQDCNAVGGATFIAGDNSIDSGGNNSGWTSSWTNRIKAYASDNDYATHTSPSGKIYARLSRDAGTTWTDAIYVTHVGAEGSLTFGDGATELWGTSWTGADMDDASFRVRIYANADDSFNYADYYDFAFDAEIAAGKTVTGIKVITEAKWDGTTTSLDHITVTAYAGDSPLEIADGSLSYDSTNDLLTIYDDTLGQWKQVGTSGGWLPANETWTYNSTTTYTNSFTHYSCVINIPSDGTTKYQPGMRVEFTQATGGTKWGIIMGVAATTITVFLGRNSTLVNQAITLPKYSYSKTPFGFINNPDDWTIQTKDTTNRDQSSPTGGTWYNINSTTIDMPSGLWEMGFDVTCRARDTSGTGCNMFIALAKISNGTDDVDLKGIILYQRASGDVHMYSQVNRKKTLAVPAADTFYLNGMTSEASMTNISYMGSTGGTTRVYGRCAYL